MCVDPLGLERRDDLLRVRDFFRIGVAALVENRAVHAHQVHAVFGQAPRALFQGVSAQIVRRPVHRPKPHRLPVRGENKSVALGRNDAVFAGEAFVQPAQVDGAFGK